MDVPLKRSLKQDRTPLPYMFPFNKALKKRIRTPNTALKGKKLEGVR